MNKQNAYKIVLEDILNMDCGMFVGKYDTKNGNKYFMYGIKTVMEMIAYKISDIEGDNFSEMFIENMIESEEKNIDKPIE